jgi:hypothetical protein
VSAVQQGRFTASVGPGAQWIRIWIFITRQSSSYVRGAGRSALVASREARPWRATVDEADACGRGARARARRGFPPPNLCLFGSFSTPR